MGSMLVHPSLSVMPLNGLSSQLNDILSDVSAADPIVLDKQWSDDKNMTLNNNSTHQ